MEPDDTPNEAEDATEPNLFAKWKLLSGKDIAIFRGTRNGELPQRGGIKECTPDGSWLQGKRLQKAYEERKEVLSEPKLERKGSLSLGEWKPALKKVHITQTKGKGWDRFGHYEGGKLYLHPEEALYLLDIGCLEVSYGDIPISIQQAYTAFFQGGDISLPDYVVYSHLNRLGFTVVRHTRSDVSLYEKQIRLDELPKRSRRKRKRSPEQSHADDNIAEKTVCVDVDLPEGKSSTEGQDMEQRNSYGENAPKCDDMGTSEVKMEDDTLKKAQCTNWDFRQIHFPDMSGKTEIYTIPLIGQGYYPSGIDTGQTFSIDINKWKADNKARGKDRKQHGNQQGQDFSLFGNNRWKISNSKARNWGELKTELRNEESMFSSPVQHLWDGDVTPLVRPEDAVSTASVLQRLSVIQGADVIKKSVSNKSEVSSRKIKFDVYPPDGKFKKSRPGLPAYRIYIMSFTDTPPNLSLIEEVMSQSSDGVPVLWAAEDNGDISFYCYHDVKLPVDIMMG